MIIVFPLPPRIHIQVPKSAVLQTKSRQFQVLQQKKKKTRLKIRPKMHQNKLKNVEQRNYKSCKLTKIAKLQNSSEYKAIQRVNLIKVILVTRLTKLTRLTSVTRLTVWNKPFLQNTIQDRWCYTVIRHEEWLISSFYPRVSQSVTMISARDASTSENNRRFLYLYLSQY